MADAIKNIEIEILETINLFTLAPWEKQVQTDIEEISEIQTEAGGSIQIAVSSSARNRIVGFGGVV